ncbi:MAG: hypothetical protein ACOCYR_08310, partial [Erythrobacter sp.]
MLARISLDHNAAAVRTIHLARQLGRVLQPSCGVLDEIVHITRARVLDLGAELDTLTGFELARLTHSDIHLADDDHRQRLVRTLTERSPRPAMMRLRRADNQDIANLLTSLPSPKGDLPMQAEGDDYLFDRYELCVHDQTRRGHGVPTLAAVALCAWAMRKLENLLVVQNGLDDAWTLQIVERLEVSLQVEIAAAALVAGERSRPAAR